MLLSEIAAEVGKRQHRDGRAIGYDGYLGRGYDRRGQIGRSGGKLRRTDAEDMHRGGDVLQVSQPKIIRRECDFPGQVLLHPGRDADTARLRHLLEPGGNIFRVAAVIWLN